MKTHRDLTAWRAFRDAQVNWAPGFVPTMGGLHAGHRSLVARSVAANDVTVVSLFLNPTQFDQGADLATYPAVFEDDLAALERWGVDHVLVPGQDAMYPDDYRYRVSEDTLSRQLCGAHRAGHFDGVLTVVLRLLNLVKPRRAYFGEKDWQQLELVRGMVEAFFLDVEIVACPIVREPSGLALSSRNARLDTDQAALAPALYRSLRDSDSAEAAAQQLATLGFEVDYVEDHGKRRLAAAHLGVTRLIDNIALDNISLDNIGLEDDRAP